MKSSTDCTHLETSSKWHYATLKQSAARSLILFRKRRREREFRGNWTYQVRLSKVIWTLTLGQSLMFGAKTLEKILGWLRQSLAHDLAPNMIKLLCTYLL